MINYSLFVMKSLIMPMVNFEIIENYFLLAVGYLQRSIDLKGVLDIAFGKCLNIQIDNKKNRNTCRESKQYIHYNQQLSYMYSQKQALPKLL